MLTKQNGLKDTESNVSVESNVETRAQHNKIVNEAMKSNNTLDEESMSSHSHPAVTIKQTIKSTKTPSEVSRDETSHNNVSETTSLKTSVKSNEHQVEVLVASHQSQDSSADLSRKSVENHVVTVETRTEHNLSQETSSLKTDSSMKDYDINEQRSNQTQPLERSHNSDVIEEVIVKKNTQVLSEKSSEKSSDLDEQSSSLKESRDASEGLKITSAFVGVVTLIAML